MHYLCTGFFSTLFWQVHNMIAGKSSFSRFSAELQPEKCLSWTILGLSYALYISLFRSVNTNLNFRLTYIYCDLNSVPSIYINDSNFYEYLGHPKSKFQNALKNFREEIATCLFYTKFGISQCRFHTIFFRIFGPVFTVKFTIYHLNSTNLFTGLGFSTYPFLW